MAGPITRVRDGRGHLERALKAIDDANRHMKMVAISDTVKKDVSLKEATLSVREKVKKAKKHGPRLWGKWVKATDSKTDGELSGSLVANPKLGLKVKGRA